MSWIVDNSLYLYVGLGIFTVTLLMAWWNTRKKEWLFAVGGFLVLLLLVLLCDFFIVTDRQLIRKAIDTIENGLENSDSSLVVQQLSKDFQYKAINGLVGKTDIEKNLTWAMSNAYYGKVTIKFWEFEYQTVDRNNKIAKVSCRMRADSTQYNGAFLAICRMEFILENGKWLMKTIGFYKPISDTDQEIPLPFPRG